MDSCFPTGVSVLRGVRAQALDKFFARTMPTFYRNTLEADNKFALVLIQPEVSSFKRWTKYLFYHIIWVGGEVVVLAPS